MSPRTRRSTWSGTSITVRSTISRLVGDHTAPRRGPRLPVRHPSTLPAPFTITVSAEYSRDSITPSCEVSVFRASPLASVVARLDAPRPMSHLSLQEARLSLGRALSHLLYHGDALFEMTPPRPCVELAQGDTPAY